LQAARRAQGGLGSGAGRRRRRISPSATRWEKGRVLSMPSSQADHVVAGKPGWLASWAARPGKHLARLAVATGMQAFMRSTRR
jgi:hypothetical protein